MADTTTLKGAFSVLINDGFSWAQYEIEAASEAAAHACARGLWAKRGERGKGDRPEGMAEGSATQTGGHKVPADPTPEPEAPAEAEAPAPATTARSGRASA